MMTDVDTTSVPDVNTLRSVGIHLEGKLVVSIKCSLWETGAARELRR